MRNFLLSFISIFFFSCSLFAQAKSSNLNIISSLKTFLSKQKEEKAYLQFDKPYYAAGDTIYFKAYITQGDRHQLSDISSVLHVDLISINNIITQSIKLHIDSGLCYGDFALPDSLASGVYRVRAYTQWMRNWGETDFFESAFIIGSLNKIDTVASKVKQSQTTVKADDLQFFPEGGTLVSGIYTKIAFKATNTNGLGIPVKGTITDNQNREVNSFASTHLGMGYFFLNPADSIAYKAHVTFSDGSHAILDLPKPASAGISLIVNTDSLLKTIIYIQANSSYYKVNRNKNFLLLVYSADKVVNAPFTLDEPLITLTLNKEQLNTGIATVTLFSPEGEPLCERLLFANNKQLSLNVSADKIVYNKRDKVSLLLNTKNTADSNASGYYSVSVIDESKVPEEELNDKNILTNLLLTNDLKGYVEQPNYYFIDSIKNSHKDLDVLMLTQGYRSFQWKNVLNNDTTPITFQPEKGVDINGSITTLTGKPVSNGTVNLIPSAGGPFLTATADNYGMFHFANLIFTDTVPFILNAVNAKGQNTTRLSYIPVADQPPVIAQQQYPQPQIADNMNVYLANTKKYRNEMANNNFGKAIILKEVKIKGKNPGDLYRTQSLVGAGNADQVMHADEIDKIDGQLTASLRGRLHGVGFSNGVPYLQAPIIRGGRTSLVNAPMLIIIDGAEVNSGGRPFDIDQIPSSQVETVEVLKYSGTSIYGVEGANGVLVITTKQQRESFRNIESVGVLSISAAGFYKARTFYSPKYEVNNVNAKEQDLRSTIYWNPEVNTNKDGDASIEYYNADGTGTFKVTIEGIDGTGNITRLIYKYKVQ